MLKNYGLRKSDFILKENTKVGKLDQNYNKKKNSLSDNYQKKHIFTLNTSSSYKNLKKDDNQNKPYSREKLYEKNKKNSKEKKLNSQLFNYNNIFTPSLEEKINFRNNSFFKGKDPNETIYKNSPLISNSYNILNNNLFNSIAISNKKDHVTDLLNYGNREQLYNYIGKKGFIYSGMLNRNYSEIRKVVQENISKDGLTEYYINNSWSVSEYAYKEESNSKYRENMEDKGKSIDGFNNDNNTGIFCIFDGHGGTEVSTYLQKNIINYFREFFLENIDIENNLIELFKIIDDKLNEPFYNTLGSTACIVYITKENSKKCFYCANIGDTRCVLINKNGAKRISYDDRATDINESNRVKSEGGIIFGGRVYGQLMLTRAFGDSGLKKYGVICIPHVYKVDIDIEDKYIIIASDGVWDVLEENEIYNYSLISKNSKDFCDIIVKKSIEKGSMDNISCFVIKLN